MSPVSDLLLDWRALGSVLLVFGFAPGAVLRMAVRAYPKDHPRRRELVAELYALRYTERPLFVAQQLETAMSEGIPARWRTRQEARRPAGLSGRFDSWRRSYLPLPAELVIAYLGEDEYVVHTDRLSVRTFLIRRLGRKMLLIALALSGLVAFNAVTWSIVAVCVVAALVQIVLVLRQLRDHHVSYVVTNLRLIRMSGVLGRTVVGIPWSRLTGLGYRQNASGRLIGDATIFIDLRTDEPEVSELTEINDPATFHQLLLDSVSTKGKRTDLDPTDPPHVTRGVHKSLRHRRREGRARSAERAKHPATQTIEPTCVTTHPFTPGVVRSAAARIDSWRRHYVPLPDEVLHEYLGEDERIVQTDHLSFQPLLVKSFVCLGLLGITGPLVAVSVGGLGWSTIAPSLLLEMILSLGALRWLAHRYTAYAITNLRLLRLSGVFGRKLISAPWSRITGIDYLPSLAKRAKIRVEAGGRYWGIREFSDITNPEMFHQQLLTMVPALAEPSDRNPIS